MQHLWNTDATPVTRYVALQRSLVFSRFFPFAVALRPMHSMVRATARNPCVTLCGYLIERSKKFAGFLHPLP
jgi:hypothetical protein